MSLFLNLLRGAAFGVVANITTDTAFAAFAVMSALVVAAVLTEMIGEVQ